MLVLSLSHSPFFDPRCFLRSFVRPFVLLSLRASSYNPVPVIFFLARDSYLILPPTDFQTARLRPVATS